MDVGVNYEQYYESFYHIISIIINIITSIIINIIIKYHCPHTTNCSITPYRVNLAPTVTCLLLNGADYSQPLNS